MIMLDQSGGCPSRCAGAGARRRPSRSLLGCVAAGADRSRRLRADQRRAGAHRLHQRDVREHARRRAAARLRRAGQADLRLGSFRSIRRRASTAGCAARHCRRVGLLHGCDRAPALDGRLAEARPRKGRLDKCRKPCRKCWPGWPYRALLGGGFHTGTAIGASSPACAVRGARTDPQRRETEAHVPGCAYPSWLNARRQRVADDRRDVRRADEPARAWRSCTAASCRSAGR